MALSTILRRSVSRVIGGGNRFHGNLIHPSASVPAFRQFCSTPTLSSKDNESLVNKDAKQLDDTLVNTLIAQVQSLQRDIESLRNSYGKPLSTVKEDEPLVKDEGIDESESVHKGVDDYCSRIAIECSNDEGRDSESDKSDDDSNDDGKDSESDKSDDDSNDDGKDTESDSSDDNSSDDSSEKLSSDSDDSSEKLSSDSDNSSDESLSETDDNDKSCDNESLSESVETLPERDDDSESGEALAEPEDDKSLPKSKENEALLKGIEAEILRAKTFMQLSAPGAVIPDDFPFKIHTEIGPEDSIVLVQEYEGELVVVRVENPTIFADKHCIGYNEKKSSSFCMDLTVGVSSLVSKQTMVELKCGASPEGISVYSAKDSDESDNEGVRMSDLSEKLKEEFGKYLEARGITLRTTNFIYKYMLDRANKERLRVLENIQKMVAN